MKLQKYMKLKSRKRKHVDFLYGMINDLHHEIFDIALSVVRKEISNFLVQK